jgi:hypothetical protein
MAHTPSSALYIPISSPTPIPSASKARRAGKGDSSCPFFSLLSLLSSHLDGAIVLLFQSKAKQSLPAQRSPSLSLNHLTTHPCSLCPSRLHLPVFQGCQDSKGANDTAPARYIAPAHEQNMCLLSALGKVVNSGEGVKGGGRPIQETVAKKVTVEVKGYLLGGLCTDDADAYSGRARGEE